MAKNGRVSPAQKKLAGSVFVVVWRAGSNSFFVPSLAFGAQTVPASHFLDAIFTKAGPPMEEEFLYVKIH